MYSILRESGYPEAYGSDNAEAAINEIAKFIPLNSDTILDTTGIGASP